MRPSAVIVLFVITSLASAQPDQRPLTIDDLYRFDDPTQLVVAPDGDFAVYVRKWIDPKTKRERHALWHSDGDRTRPLEAGEPDARAPMFSPDGRWIVFLSTRPRPA